MTALLAQLSDPHLRVGSDDVGSAAALAAAVDAVLALEARLDGDEPTIVAMHHPPLVTGIGGLDAIGLPEHQRAALAALLARSPHVRRVAAGHVHRGAFGVLGRCGVIACPSTNLQARLQFRSDGFEFGNEPPALVLHADLGGELVSHVQPI